MPESTQQEYFASDRPIPTRSDDRLGRGKFAEAIATAIRGWRGRDSLVIALYGPWGSGKSSIKNMVIEALREHLGTRGAICEFNPWSFATREQLTTAFFDQVGIELQRGAVASKEERRRLLNRWRRYAAYLKASKDLVSVVQKPLGLTLGVAGLLLAGSVGLDMRYLSLALGLVFVAGGAVLSLSSRVAELVADFLRIGVEVGKRSLKEVKADLEAEFKRLELPMIVLVDDVDRLTPSETLEMFQLIKANADFPNVVYLLLFDRATVESNIEKILEVAGRAYLEKIVQVAFGVPLIEVPRLRQVLFEGLNRLVEDEAVARRNVSTTLRHRRPAFTVALRPSRGE